MSKRISILTYPRIHTTLIGMNDDGYRINGGVGFSISTPRLKMSFEITDVVVVSDNRKYSGTVDELKKIESVLLETINYLGLSKGVSCVIEGDAYPHCGFGTTTAISLACIEALFILNGITYTRDEVIYYSGRGGTSGIGVNTYFDGGFVFDVGVKNSGQRLRPSSINNESRRIAPLVIKECQLPKWQIGLCIPSLNHIKTESQEVDFFSLNCPIEKCFVESILYESVYGITSSIIECDYNVFCQSVNAIQETQWKLLERNNYGQYLFDAERVIMSLGADCVGMSSFGPLLYFLSYDNMMDIISKLHTIMPTAQLYKSMFNNSGRVIEYD